jgi:hypothetical protein
MDGKFKGSGEGRREGGWFWGRWPTNPNSCPASCCGFYVTSQGAWGAGTGQADEQVSQWGRLDFLGLVFFFFCFVRALLLLPIYSQLLFLSLSLPLSLISGRNHTCYGSSIWPRLSFIMKSLSLSLQSYAQTRNGRFCFHLWEFVCVCVRIFFLFLRKKILHLGHINY